MAYEDQEHFSSNVADKPLRASATKIQAKTFAGGSGTLGKLTPVTFNTSTNFWQVWGAGTVEISTITSNATPATAGDFTLTVDGNTTAAIAFDATAADIQAALEALPNIAPGDVTAVATTGVDLGDASAVVTLTWGGVFVGLDVALTATMGGLTGNAHVLAEATAGVVDAYGTSVIAGFLWPDEVVLATGEVLGQVMLAGEIHYDDIPLPSGETEADLKAALRSGPRALGIYIQGLTEVR